MKEQKHVHKVSLNDRRRDNKKANDFRSKGVQRNTLAKVFNTYYREQVQALFNVVSGKK